MVNLHLIEELRKSRQLAGATINAHNIAQAHTINMELYFQRLTHDTIELSQVDFPGYSGTVGYGVEDFAP
jgi:hypothetical protein